MTNTTRSQHTRPELVDLPAEDVLAVDGAGPAEGATFQEAVAALYAALGSDAPLQGTFWSDADRMRLDLDDPAGWQWMLALPLPDGHPGPAPDGPVRVETVPAHRAVRLLHHGSYEDEGPSLAALYEHAAAAGLRPTGPHTEVYLTDPRVVAPADLRAELRLPLA